MLGASQSRGGGRALLKRGFGFKEGDHKIAKETQKGLRHSFFGKRKRDLKVRSAIKKKTRPLNLRMRGRKPSWWNPDPSGARARKGERMYGGSRPSIPGGGGGGGVPEKKLNGKTLKKASKCRKRT